MKGQTLRLRGPLPATRIIRSEHVYVVPRANGDRYAIAIDRHGKLAWSDGKVEGDPLVSVLSEQVPDSYLAFLKDKGVSYLFAGKRTGELDLSLALEKLRTKFGVKRLLLEGGGETNGSFLRAGLVDELSMLLTPVADGRPGEPALFDVEGESPARAVARLRLKSVRRAAADMLWIKYAVKRSGL